MAALLGDDKGVGFHGMRLALLVGENIAVSSRPSRGCPVDEASQALDWDMLPGA